MRVTVKLFATLTHFYSGAKAGKPIEIDLPEGAIVKDLIDYFQIPIEEAHVIFINNIIIEPDTKLSDGDVIGIFPPVGGG